jgi:hypothetical protein
MTRDEWEAHIRTVFDTLKAPVGYRNRGRGRKWVGAEWQEHWSEPCPVLLYERL